MTARPPAAKIRGFLLRRATELSSSSLSTLGLGPRSGYVAGPGEYVVWGIEAHDWEVTSAAQQVKVIYTVHGRAFDAMIGVRTLSDGRFVITEGDLEEKLS